MKKYNSDSVRKHPFDLLFAESNPKFLVIGSFPTTPSKMSFDFFYPNSLNKFWKVMDFVFPESKIRLNTKVSINDAQVVKLQNEMDRKHFCIENKIALTDMLASCIRLDDNAKDDQLLVHRYTPIIKFLQEHKSIDRIILTAKSSGASAHHHFYQYLTMNEIEFEFDGTEQISKGEIKVDTRTINILSIASTSPLNRHISFDELVDLYKKAFN